MGGNEYLLIGAPACVCTASSTGRIRLLVHTHYHYIIHQYYKQQIVNITNFVVSIELNAWWKDIY